MHEDLHTIPTLHTLGMVAHSGRWRQFRSEVQGHPQQHIKSEANLGCTRSSKLKEIMVSSPSVAPFVVSPAILEPVAVTSGLEFWIGASLVCAGKLG